jgi:hypothetical protein
MSNRSSAPQRRSREQKHNDRRYSLFDTNFRHQCVHTVLKQIHTSFSHSRNVAFFAPTENDFLPPDWDSPRPVTLPAIKIFIICFSIISPLSLDNIQARWKPELSHRSPHTPFIVCGTHADLRDDINTIQRMESKGERPISQEQGQQLAQQLGAAAYCETTIRDPQTYDSVISKAVQVVNSPKGSSSQSNRCSLM